MFTIHENIIAEYKKIIVQIQNLELQIKSLPTGKLICAKNNNYYKWYQSDGHTKTYIPKKHRKLAEQLALKKHLALQLEELSHIKQSLDAYLNTYSSTKCIPNHLLQNPEYQTLLAPHFKPISEELALWMQEPYKHNTVNPEQLIHKCSSGNYVRSKSESMIDMYLYMNKIPFRYECALNLGEITIFPDFTIRHPKTAETYFWEHFGLMDNLAYAKNAFSKMQLYNSNGIIPSIQLITTFETKDHPLSTDNIIKLIDEYFL